MKVPEAFAPACEGIPVFRPKWVGGLCGLYCNDTCTPIGPNTEEEARKVSKNIMIGMDICENRIFSPFGVFFTL